MSGSPDVSNLFVSPYSNSFVSQSGWWCPALWMSPIHLSPLVAIHLSPIVTGGVWLSACLQFICFPLPQFICLPVLLVVSGSPFVFPYSNSSVSHCDWWCLALRMSPIHLFPLQQFICLPVWLVVSGSPFVSPYHNSFVSQSGWWCPALRMSPIHLSPLIAIQLSPHMWFPRCCLTVRWL